MTIKCSGYADNTVFSFDLFQKTIKKSILNQFKSLLYLSTSMACYTKLTMLPTLASKNFLAAKIP